MMMSFHQRFMLHELFLHNSGHLSTNSTSASARGQQTYVGAHTHTRTSDSDRNQPSCTRLSLWKPIRISILSAQRQAASRTGMHTQKHSHLYSRGDGNTTKRGGGGRRS
jgi:hypothetical protein